MSKDLLKIDDLIGQLSEINASYEDNGWRLIEPIGKPNYLQRIFKFENYLKALEFVKAAALIANEQDHHPSITLEWGKVKIETYSHDVEGLSQRDINLVKAIEKLSS
jgi:4a-hydroxytetrahydrobiopterin dehydratase